MLLLTPQLTPNMWRQSNSPVLVIHYKWLRKMAQRSKSFVIWSRWLEVKDNYYLKNQESPALLDPAWEWIATGPECMTVTLDYTTGQWHVNKRGSLPPKVKTEYWRMRNKSESQHWKLKAFNPLSEKNSYPKTVLQYNTTLIIRIRSLRGQGGLKNSIVRQASTFNQSSLREFSISVKLSEREIIGNPNSWLKSASSFIFHFHAWWTGGEDMPEMPSFCKCETKEGSAVKSSHCLDSLQSFLLRWSDCYCRLYHAYLQSK